MVFEIIFFILGLSLLAFFIGPKALAFFAGAVSLIMNEVSEKIEETIVEWRELFDELKKTKRGRRND